VRVVCVEANAAEAAGAVPVGSDIVGVVAVSFSEMAQRSSSPVKPLLCSGLDQAACSDCSRADRRVVDRQHR